jgi:hypothetical protein
MKLIEEAFTLLSLVSEKQQSSDPVDTLEKFSVAKLKSIIAAAVKQHGIDSSWSAPKTNDKDELIEHINELCNEFDLRVFNDGSLDKKGAK